MQVSDKAYAGHGLFSELAQYAKFYDCLATSIFQFLSMGTSTICNIDSYVYASMQGTLKSIKAILLAGQINDAYALLRKYHDSVVINIYSNLYLKNNFSIDNFLVEMIDGWLRGDKSLPEYRVMSRYIKNSSTLKPINDVFGVDDRYKRIRDRCNDHIHYNFFKNVMLNDSTIYLKNRGKYLEVMSKDVRDIFILHLGYTFFLNDHYMMSSDYRDALDCNANPEEGSQYWVAPFVQDIFNDVITLRRPDIAAAIKANSKMQLL